MNQDFPQRKPVRLKEYDYAQNGFYFVTICTQDRECLFGQVIIEHVGATRGSPAYVQLNQNGFAVEEVLRSLPEHHNVDIFSSQIMPNHIHLIINLSGGSRPAPTLGNIVGLFKSECTKEIRRISNNPEMTVWQRNYYEHIVRDEGDLNRIREYIESNPDNWADDELFV